MFKKINQNPKHGEFSSERSELESMFFSKEILKLEIY